MLTRMFSAVPSVSRPLLGSVAALSLVGAAAAFGPVHAGGIRATTCVGSYGTFSCVTQWGASGDPYGRRPPSAQDDAEAAERERQWVARCRPVIWQDRYGVGRYAYAAPGCEFGIFQD
jgi:hypothetical protein